MDISIFGSIIQFLVNLLVQFQIYSPFPAIDHDNSRQLSSAFVLWWLILQYNMDPYQTAPLAALLSGLIEFASMKKLV